MEYFSSDPKADTISRVRGEIMEVKSIMIENVEKVLDRGERLDLLVGKTELLQGEAFAFRREARRLKHKMWWKVSTDVRHPSPHHKSCFSLTVALVVAECAAVDDHRRGTGLSCVFLCGACLWFHYEEVLSTPRSQMCRTSSDLGNQSKAPKCIL
jgi:hypothetical protein